MYQTHHYNINFFVGKLVPLSPVGATTPNGKGGALRSGPSGFPQCCGNAIPRPQNFGARRRALWMERRSDQSKGQSKSLSPSRSPSTSRKLSSSTSLKFEVEHHSPKFHSDNKPIISPDFHQNYPEVQYLIENLERVSISTENYENSQSSKISVSSSS